MRILLAAALALPIPLAQYALDQFALDPGSIPSGAPFNQSTTEQVDYGDVDLDGDWDVAMADGGDSGNDQNRIWINQGGLQAGVKGFFVDETEARLPVINDQSRDVEFADYDGDGDVDLYVSNSAQISVQPSRFWTNQGVGLGAFVDETHLRWVGIGAPGSSVPPSLVLASGGFIDWSHDGEFGDLDNDGDLDLVHVSIGNALSGFTPTRMFLNDGAGFFTEHNPSGFQLTSSTIADGSPALWAEGIHVSDTMDRSGAEADIATSAEDADLADVDGDFDLDLLLGDKMRDPRLFANRLEGSALAPGAGALLFRDVTHAAFLPGYASNHCYAQEFGDLDGDGDLDLLGVNWGTGGTTFVDKVLVNDGSGHFFSEHILIGSEADDVDGDLLDFDSDGDLDLYVANFSGQDKLYRNDTTPAGFAFARELLPAWSQISLDADSADLDGDGDPEVLIAHEVLKANVLLHNGYDVPDVHGPRIPALESVSSASAFAGVLPVRAHVLDNAPYYVTYHADVALEVTVDGAVLPPFAMQSSGGQVFRGELPGNLVGAVGYRVVAADEYGNAGSSASQGYAASGDAGTSFGAPSSGGTTSLASLTATFAGATSYLRASAPPGAALFVGASLAKLDPPLAVPGLANLVLNLAPPVTVIASGAAGAGGDLVVAAPIPAAGAGWTIHLQAVSFDGATLESSQGLSLAILP